MCIDNFYEIITLLPWTDIDFDTPWVLFSHPLLGGI